MVRINLVPPMELMDQHLIAEYNEVLILLGYVKKNPKIELEKIPKDYVLGKGHILFFKNKLKYLKRRHELIKKEMYKRGFKTNKTISLRCFPKKLCNDWNPYEKDFVLIRKRIKEKIDKKPNWYRYYGKNIESNKTT